MVQKGRQRQRARGGGEGREKECMCVKERSDIYIRSHSKHFILSGKNSHMACKQPYMPPLCFIRWFGNGRIVQKHWKKKRIMANMRLIWGCITTSTLSEHKQKIPCSSTKSQKVCNFHVEIFLIERNQQCNQRILNFHFRM